MSRTFADLGVSRAVVRALAERDITEPFAIQDLGRTLAAALAPVAARRAGQEGGNEDHD